MLVGCMREKRVSMRMKTLFIRERARDGVLVYEKVHSRDSFDWVE